MAQGCEGLHFATSCLVVPLPSTPSTTTARKSNKNNNRFLFISVKFQFHSFSKGVRSVYLAAITCSYQNTAGLNWRIGLLVKGSITACTSEIVLIGNFASLACSRTTSSLSAMIMQ